MLPRATRTRTPRERGQLGGRTQEIQRLIGRSVRAMLDDFRVRRVHAARSTATSCRPTAERERPRSPARASRVVDAFDWMVAQGEAASDLRSGVASRRVSVGVVDGEAAPRSRLRRGRRRRRRHERRDEQRGAVRRGAGHGRARHVRSRGAGSAARPRGRRASSTLDAAQRQRAGRVERVHARGCWRRAATASCASCARLRGGGRSRVGSRARRASRNRRTRTRRSVRRRSRRTRWRRRAISTSDAAASTCRRRLGARGRGARRRSPACGASAGAGAPI